MQTNWPDSQRDREGHSGRTCKYPSMLCVFCELLEVLGMCGCLTSGWRTKSAFGGDCRLISSGWWGVSNVLKSDAGESKRELQKSQPCWISLVWMCLDLFSERRALTWPEHWCILAVNVFEGSSVQEDYSLFMLLISHYSIFFISSYDFIFFILMCSY